MIKLLVIPALFIIGWVWGFLNKKYDDRTK